MKKLKLSLKEKAIIGIIATLVPILITFVLIYRQNRVYLKNRTLDTLTIIAEAYEGQVYQFLEMAKRRTHDFSSDGFIRTKLQEILHGNTSAIGELNEHLVKNKLVLDKTINVINILSLEGRVVASTNNAEIERDFSSETIFVKGKETVTMVEKCFGHCKLTEIAISAPILNIDTGRLIGVIVNYIPIAELDNIVTGKYAHDLGAVSWNKGKGAWKTLEIYLVNRDKLMITKSIFVKDAVWKQAVDTLPINEGSTSNKGITGFYRDYRGVEVAGASIYVPSMKWMLLVEIDKSEVLSPIRRILISSLITAAVVIVMMVLLFIGFMKRMVKPLQKISDAAKNIANGNFDVSVPVQTHDEIGVLCESFNYMTRHIKTRTTALVGSEARLAESQQIAHLGSWEWDIVKNKTYESDEFYRIYGLVREGFGATYEAFLNCVHPDDRESVRKSVENALQNKKPYDIEFRILRKDGTVRIVHEKAVVTFDNTGRAIQMVGTVQDITERKRAEEELNTEKNKFLAVINAMEDGLTIQDLDYNIIYQNETVKNIFGSRLGEKCYSTYEGKNSICDGCPVEMVYKDGKSHISERRVVLPSGEIAFYENIASPIIDASGKIVSCLEIVRNITGRKQAEAEMNILQTIIMTISASKDLHDALVVVIQMICNFTGWVYGEAWKPNPDGTLLERDHAYYSSIEGFEKFSAFTEGMTFPSGIGLPGRAWSAKQPVWVRDVTLDPKYLRASIAREVGLKTGIAFPIVADNEVVAVVVFYHVKVEERDEQLVKLVLTVLSQIGSIIKRKRAEEALRESEEKLRAILDNTPNVVYVKDIRNKYLFINKQFENLFHVKGEELQGKTDYDLWPKEMSDAFVANDRKVVEAGTPLEFEEVAPHDDGLHTYISVKFPLFDVNGTVYAVCGISTDITEHKRADDLLIEQSRLATLGAEVGFALARKDTLCDMLQKCSDAFVRNLNMAFARIWTLNTEENVLELQSSAGIYTHIDGPHRRVPVGMYKIGLIATERKPHLTNKAIGDPGIHNQEWAKQMGIVAFAGYPLMIEDHIVGVLAMFSTKPIPEFTFKALASVSDMIALGIERMRTQERLEKYGILFSEITDLAYICDTKGNILFVNKVFEKLTGHKPESFFGKSSAQLFDEENQKKATDAYMRTLKGESPQYELYFKDTGVLCEYKNMPLKDGNGNVIGVMGVARDITMRKQMEKEQVTLKEQLFHAQKLESIGTLAGGIAHDFNNILTAIIGYGNLLQREMKDEPSSKDFVQKILKSAERAANLTQGLLAFSRKQPGNPEPVNVNTIVKEAESLLSMVIRGDIKFKTSLTGKGCVVMADIGQIEQVLMNLTTNARDAMPTGGILSISTDIVEMDAEYIKAHGYGKVGKYALISVSDTGKGMDEKTKERIFVPFFTTKEVGKGTGLGLAIVYGIIKQHNGYINVYSEPGKGTTFRIYIPLIESGVKRKRPDIHVIQKGGIETVLIAEDEEEVRNLMKMVLEDHGYKVIEAVDGVDAVDKFKENMDKIRLLLFDVTMPNKSGKEAYDAINEIRPGIKAIFMSGYSKDIIQEDISSLGLHFISKPILPTELLKKVREALDR